MRLVHRIRMLRLNLEANILLARVNRASKPKNKGVFLYGYQFGKTPREYGITPLYIIGLIVVFYLIYQMNRAA